MAATLYVFFLHKDVTIVRAISHPQNLTPEDVIKDYALKLWEGHITEANPCQYGQISWILPNGESPYSGYCEIGRDRTFINWSKREDCKFCRSRKIIHLNQLYFNNKII